MGEDSDNNPAERRQFPRHACEGEAEIWEGERVWGWGTVSDISRGGCYIETRHPLAVDTEARLLLTIHGSRLEIRAIVISSLPLFGMGMAFVLESREEWTELARIVEKVTDLPPSEQRANNARPHMEAALQLLQEAEEELRKEMQDMGGHRLLRALHFMEDAISEVKKRVEIEVCHRAPITMERGAVQREKPF